MTRLDPAARARRSRPAHTTEKPKDVTPELWPTDGGGQEEPFIDAPEVAKVLRDALDYHSDLVNVEISCVFVKETMSRGGRSIAARIVKVPPLMRHISGKRAVLKVAWAAWTNMKAAERLAMVDTELCRLHRKIEGDALETVSPVEVFPEALNRHGAWNEELTKVQAAIKQMPIKFPTSGESVGASAQA
jgi:hypothetical protein